MVRFLIVLLGLTALTACRRGPGIAVRAPEGTPEGASLYVAGNFNHWNPRDEDYLLWRDPETGVYHAWLPYGFGTLEYKITRGDWATVEVDSCGNEIPNRRLAVESNKQVGVTVASWKDLVTVICSKTVLRLSLPPHTLDSGRVFASGTFNQWALADARFEARTGDDGAVYCVIPRVEQGVEFRLNMGDWGKSEADAAGLPVKNRKLDYRGPDTLHLNIKDWSHWVARNHPTLTLLVEIPHHLPEGEHLYLAADFDDWDPGNRGLRFRHVAGRNYALTIPRRGEEMYFKITRGSWATVETTSHGQDIPNRNHVFGRSDTLRISVDGWHDGL